MPNRDVVVLGASAGGVEALKRVVGGVPKDLPAALLVVLHTAPDAPSGLAFVLDRGGPLHAKTAEHGEHLQHGHIYVAPPNNHLAIVDGSIHLGNGPRENLFRPSVDVLFRSAAVEYRSRVIGIVLSGYLDDGAAGLFAIHRCGGLTVVQDPDDALSPSMPRNAARLNRPDFCVPAAEMGELLSRLTSQEAPMPPPVPGEIQIEAGIRSRSDDIEERVKGLGTLSPLICTECGGPLWEIEDNEPPRYRCRLGHAFTARSLLLQKLEASSRSHGYSASAERYAERSAGLREHIQTLRSLILSDESQEPEMGE